MLRSLRTAALSLALLALPLAAQQFPPAQQRGLSADTAYTSGALDSANLFSGNLSLSVPLLDPSTVTVQNPLNAGPNWFYVSADGGHHALYPRLHPGYPATPASGILYSNGGWELKFAAPSCRRHFHGSEH